MTALLAPWFILSNAKDPVDAPMVQPSIKQLEIGPMMNFAYLVADDEAKVCAVVDPGWDAPAIADAARAAGWTIEKILLTHAHFDHAGALADLVKITGAKVFVHREELEEVGGQAIATADGSSISVGSMELRCLHTPGHTPGSQCFLTDAVVFTGDTLFIDGCGRVDLPGSDPAQMISSLKRLASLDPTITVYPGHDYGRQRTATIGELLESNEYLRATSSEQLL